jgi:hypothetical protein
MEDENNQPVNVDLTKGDIENIYLALTTPALVPEIDKAFRQVYANNVKNIVIATAIEGNSLWDKLSKIAPAIIIIATGLFIVLALYGFQPIFNAELAHHQLLVSVICNGTRGSQIVNGTIVPSV